jgi:hypothetical protein
MQFSLQTKMNETLQARRETNWKPTSWNCSKLGSCLTGVYLERLGVKPDTEFTDRELRVFAAGHLFEEFFADLVKDYKDVKIERQVRVEDKKLDVTGYADMVVEVDGQKLVYEIKSKNSRAFWYMEKKGEGANKQHQMQIWLYMHILGIEEGRLLYLEKDTLTTLEYPIYLKNQELEESVMKELDILNRAWKEQLPPPVLYTDKDWQSKYCRFHSQCKTCEKYLTI